MSRWAATAKLIAMIVAIYAVCFGLSWLLVDESEGVITALFITSILALFPIAFLPIPYARAFFHREFDRPQSDPTSAFRIVIERDPFGIALTCILSLFTLTFIGFPIANNIVFGNEPNYFLIALGAGIFILAATFFTPVARTRWVFEGNNPHTIIHARSGAFFGFDARFDQIESIAFKDTTTFGMSFIVTGKLRRKVFGVPLPSRDRRRRIPLRLDGFSDEDTAYIRAFFA